VIGASAGGMRALTTLVRALPRDFPAAIFVVLHVPPTSTSMVPWLLAHASPLPASHACDREPVRHGRIYVAPPDHHVVVEDGRVRLTGAATEHGHRPAVDVLFRSAALAYGPRCVGVVLSGARRDGASGLTTIKSCGGLAVVQDPAEACFPSMPRSALESCEVDHVASSSELGPLLKWLVTEPIDHARQPVCA
jgi:two-component system, chemotaxis family, protein-glutamate methylesterase/glutaminase